MNITITESAKSQLQVVANKNEIPYVRYALKGGGCSGLLGGWFLQRKDELEADDFSFDVGDDKALLIDPFTMNNMDGATIDYTGDFMPAFKVSIPDTSSCGCGESFVMNT